MADATKSSSATEIRESIEAKVVGAGHDTNPADAHNAAENAGDDDAEVDQGAEDEVDTTRVGEGKGDEADADGDPEDEFDDDEDDQAGMSSNMLTVIENTANYLTSYREPDGYQIAQAFQRVPNRRLVPDYYEVIDEAIAFSTIRTKKLKKQYSTFSEFVTDVAKICHNAQVYNRPSSHFFQDATRLREVFKQELQKLVDDETITPEEAVLPDLGPLPEAEDSPPPEEYEEDEDDEEEEDDEDDDDDDDESDDEDGRPRGRGRGGRKSDSKDDQLQKRGRRPPKVFTAIEARIYAFLKGLRKFRHPQGDLLIFPFERLPDKQSTPDYYAAIRNPIALDSIKKKAKRKKYQNLDQVLNDVDLMFENAKVYNEEDSQIYKDAVELQSQARILAEQEKARPDDEFEDEEGRRPVPELQHKGESWKVGDWVHITNPNDLTKPIVAQIYRTYIDKAGKPCVNACWYYRPEQTVHRFEKFFFENEVVKTGQYRDHGIDEIADRCFVMFITRFNKGRPRGLAKDKEVYVCEARYNEEKHRLNKIKTWASCLPDEVREKDYVMDLLDVPRKLKKYPSPIKHLLRDDAKPGDPLPKPTWGAPNAPPLVGAVHCREREANESPPPEPTPSPPPPLSTDTARRPSMMQRPTDSQGDIAMGNTSHFAPVAAPPTPSSNAYTAHFSAARPSPTPIPVPQHGSHTAMHYSATASTPQTPHYTAHQPHQSTAYNGFAPPYNPAPVPVSHHTHHPPPMSTTPIVPYDPTRLAPSPARSGVAPAPLSGMHAQPNTYTPPRPVEVYTLNDDMNARIPHDIREQFQRDARGRVLFFTQPPLDRAHRGLSSESAGLGHSIRYLADRARGIEDRRAKRRARDELRKEEESKKRARNQEEAKRERARQIDAAGDVLIDWMSAMNKENEALKKQYDGWSVRDELIDVHSGK